MLRVNLVSVCGFLVMRMGLSILSSVRPHENGDNHESRPIALLRDALAFDGEDEAAPTLQGSRVPDGDIVTYDHLPKTGGTFLNMLFRAVLNSKDYKYIYELGGVTRDNELGDFVMGNTRNPCDYYVSLWAYGVEHGGYMRQRVPDNEYLYGAMSPNKDSHADIMRFRKWLKRISIPGQPGTLSVRFSRSYSDLDRKMFPVDTTSSLPASLLNSTVLVAVKEGLEKFDTSSMDCWIEHESLRFSVSVCLDAWEKNTGGTVDWEAFSRSFQAANVESHGKTTQHGLCKDYFDEDSEKLVRDVDRLIFRKLGYQTCCAGR